MSTVDDTPHYTPIEDAQGLIVSAVLAALAVHLLRAAGLISSGTAGTALIVAYVSDWSFGAVFFVVNLPFYALAWHARGPLFCVKSLAAVTLLSVGAELLKPLLSVASIHPGAAAVLFGVTAGVGLLGLFRHSASLGGVSIVALIVSLD